MGVQPLHGGPAPAWGSSPCMGVQPGCAAHCIRLGVQPLPEPPLPHGFKNHDGGRCGDIHGVDLSQHGDFNEVVGSF